MARLLVGVISNYTSFPVSPASFSRARRHEDSCYSVLFVVKKIAFDDVAQDDDGTNGSH